MSQENVEIVKRLFAAVARGDVEGVIAGATQDARFRWSSKAVVGSGLGSVLISRESGSAGAQRWRS
jgi:ketosteroid isomerase-like protein